MFGEWLRLLRLASARSGEFPDSSELSGAVFRVLPASSVMETSLAPCVSGGNPSDFSDFSESVGTVFRTFPVAPVPKSQWRKFHGLD